MATEYEDRFEAAELPHKLNRAEELLNGLTESEVDGIEQHRPHELTRIRAAILALRPRIKASDPLLIGADVLDQTNGSLSSLIDASRAYRDDGNVEHFNPVPQWSETLVGAIPRWPAGPDLPVTDASNVATRFRRSAGQQLRGLKTDFEKVKEEVAAFQQDLENRTGQWGEEKTNLETQVNELSGTIDQQRGRLDQAIENYQGQFSEAQERRNEEHRTQLARFQEEESARDAKAQEEFNDIKSDFALAVNTADEKSDETLADLRAELAKAQDITGFIGATGTAAGYGEEANSQKKTADWLRGLAIFFGLLAAGLAVWAVIHAERSSSPSLTVVISKAVGSLVFAGLAGYVATQSGHHRLREEQARRRELDLLALPAFIATLPEEEKEEITGQVATKLFLTQATNPTGKPEAALTKESISLIGLLLDAIRRS
jgi:hypothetical protein